MLGGISNHMDGSFDRKYFAIDRCYPDFAPNVYLYKRGDKNPIATFEISQDEYTTWKLQVHQIRRFRVTESVCTLINSANVTTEHTER